MKRDLLWLTALALVARSVAALLVPHPPYTDPAYYVLVADRLADGFGFTVPVLWSFLEVGGSLPSSPALPVASNGHWMPMTSLLSVPFIWALEPVIGAWRAAQVPFVILSTALVPFTYWVGWELWRSRLVARMAGILAVLAGPFLIYYPQVNNIAAFGAFGAGAVWCCIRSVSSTSPGWLPGAGVLAGLATLTRVDGLLLAVPILVAWWLGRRSAVPLLLAALAFVVVMAPWLVRNLAVFGSPFPSAGGHTLWITTYNQQFSILADPSVASHLAAGLGTVVGARLATWVELAGRVTVLLGGIFVLPFVYGLWVERRRRELAPFVAYFATVFVVMGLVFTFHAPHGAFYHSAGAWLPFALPLAVASVPGLADAAGRWWRFLRRPATHRFLLVAGVVGAAVLSLAGSAVVYRGWAVSQARLESAAGFLASAAEPGDRVMAYDPARLYELVPLEGVPPPFDPFAVVDRVVDAYDVRWVVVTLAADDERDPLGLWDGAAGRDIRGEAPSFLPSLPTFEAPGVRVYEVGE